MRTSLSKLFRICGMLTLFTCCSVFATDAFAQSRKLTGTVTDLAGQPLPGATVMVQGSSNLATATDMDGTFTLNVPQGATITVSYIGFVSKNVAVGNQTTIQIQLEEDAVALEDVVVIGYGVQKKSDVTGAIAQVKSDDIENRTATNAAQAMQGKAAGVQIINTSGAPGSSQSIRIRGYSSNSGTSPLMIVDGLKVSDIGYLDPENIASMEVLKDAASAAIYGIEAGNGVILITTKTGSASKGNGRVFYNFQQTFQNVAHIPEMMNAKQYMEYMIEQGSFSQSDFDLYYDGHTDTNWRDLMFETGQMQRHTVGFQGGNDRGNLYVSLTSMSNNGIILGDKDTFNRLTGQINADYKIKDWITAGITASLNKSKSKSVSEGHYQQASTMASIMVLDPLTPWTYDPNNVPARIQNWVNAGEPLARDPEGNIYGTSAYISSIFHPIAFRDRQDAASDGFNINGTAYVNVTPIKNFVYTSRLGYRAGYSNNSTYDYDMFFNGSNAQAYSLSSTSRNNLYYQWENFANYSFDIKQHNITAMAGMSYINSTSNYVSGSANQLVDTAENFRYLNGAVNTPQMTVGGIVSQSASVSYFGRLGWSYKNKYMLQGNFRADAYDSSKLDKDHRWGYFPSVSAGWTLSNEKFMQNFISKSGITFLKLRASWGVNGNVNALGAYQYATTLSASATSSGIDFGNGSGQVTGVTPSSTLPNPEIKWETSEQLDLGLDLRMFRDRLTLGLDWYNKNTNNLLTSTTPPANTGASRVYVNAGKVNNKGFEIETSWRDSFGDFRYSVNGNISFLKNNVVEGVSADRLAGEQIQSAYQITFFEQGYPIWYLRGFVVDHIDPTTGAAIYKDFDGNGTINDQDRDYIGSGIPDFTYGLTINLAYKNIDLVVYGAGSQGNEMLWAMNRADEAAENRLLEFYDNRWTPSNSNPKYQKPSTTDSDKWICSDAMVFDASFFKIKQIQLGYTLPSNWLSKVKIAGLRAYVSMDDWFTFTKYPGLDPETMNGTTTTLGLDRGAYPISKKLVFGVNLSF